MEIDISKLKAGDSYFNKFEGWVKIRGVEELFAGRFEVVDVRGDSLLDGVVDLGDLV